MLLTIHYGHLKESPYVYLKCIALADIVYLLVEMSLVLVRCDWCQYSLRTAYNMEVYYWFVLIGRN